MRYSEPPKINRTKCYIQYGVLAALSLIAALHSYFKYRILTPVVCCLIFGALGISLMVAIHCAADRRWKEANARKENHLVVDASGNRTDQ